MYIKYGFIVVLYKYWFLHGNGLGKDFILSLEKQVVLFQFVQASLQFTD